MSWALIQQHFKSVKAAYESGESTAAAWSAYRDVVLASRDNPPYHLIAPLRIAEDAAAQRGMQNVRILDHGCGTGSTLLYLLACGFTGIYGVDVRGDMTGLNRLMESEFGISEQRFRNYDGYTLPFEDDTFDLVISEEVVEHVPDAAIATYYAEGARTLRRDGISYHTVPHRLGPYETHTRTWLIHYLPRSWALRYYGDPRYYDYLFLRWPGFHKKKLREHYALTEDITRKRLMALTNFEYYDGSVRLRRLLTTLSRAPLLGPALTSVIVSMLMRQTLASKSQRALPHIF